MYISGSASLMSESAQLYSYVLPVYFLSFKLLILITFPLTKRHLLVQAPGQLLQLSCKRSLGIELSMELINSDGPEAEMLFSWPYRFYTPEVSYPSFLAASSLQVLTLDSLFSKATSTYP